MKTKVIGYVRVDSGQLLIIDPCYLDKWTDGDFAGWDKVSNNSYAKVCNITLSKEKAGETDEGGVVFASGYGDGNYPIIATYNEDNRIVKVEIKMN